MLSFFPLNYLLLLNVIITIILKITSSPLLLIKIWLEDVALGLLAKGASNSEVRNLTFPPSPRQYCPWMRFPDRKWASESPGGLVETWAVGLSLRVSDWAGVRWRPRICILKCCRRCWLGDPIWKTAGSCHRGAWNCVPSVGSLAPKTEHAELNSLGNFFPSFHLPYGVSKVERDPVLPQRKETLGIRKKVDWHRYSYFSNLYLCLHISSSVFWLTLEPAWETPKITYLAPAPGGSNPWSGEALSSSI